MRSESKRGSSVFENWTRKLSGLAAIVVTAVTGSALVAKFTVIFKALAIGTTAAPVVSLAEWADFAKETAIAFGIVATVAGVKSVATDFVANRKAKAEGNGGGAQS